MKFIDLFAGIGGFRSGLEKAGHKCVGYVEWDKSARQSYQAMYDTQGEFTDDDIQRTEGIELPEADLWTFGSPCTNISLAGNRAGIRGEQSRMFFEVIRLLKERAENQKTLPTYLIMENVKSLLSSNQGRDFAEVIYQMDKVGYDAEWCVFDSAEVVPQHRERIYIVGHFRGKCTRKIFPIVRQSETTNQKPEIKIIGNTSKTCHHSDDIMSDKGISKTITAQNAYKHTPKVAVHQIGQLKKTASFGGNPQVGRVYGADGLSPTLSTMQGGGREPKILDNLRIRKLTPRECWRLQGFKDEQFDKAKKAGVSNSQLYKQAGNAVTVPVVRAIGEKLMENEAEKEETKPDTTSGASH